MFKAQTLIGEVWKQAHKAKFISTRVNLNIVAVLLHRIIAGVFIKGASIQMKALFLGTLALSVSLTTASANVIISEYVEGSGNNKALELYNTASESVDLSAYEIQIYYNGSVTPGRTWTLEGELAPAQTWVVASSAADPQLLTVADQVLGGGWFNGDDAIVLRRGDQINDSFGQIGIDPGAAWSNNGVSTRDQTLRRLSTSPADTNPNDSYDDPSVTWASFPQNSFEDLGAYSGSNPGPDPEPEPEPEPGQCGDSYTLISAVQGNGAASPMQGEQVEVEGIVTGDFQAAFGGFYIQSLESDEDADASTSEGLYIYTGRNAIAVARGDWVRVQGRVIEFRELTELTDVSLLDTCANDEPLPPATALTLPYSDLAALESLEGMRVDATGLYVQNTYNLARFGELTLSQKSRLYQPTQVAKPGADAQAIADENSRSQITLDDGLSGSNNEFIPLPEGGLSASNTVRVGQKVEVLEAIMDQRFGSHRLQLVSGGQFSDNPRPENIEKPRNSNLRVVNFNVKNFFNGDGQGGGFPTARGAKTPEELVRQKEKLVTAIIAMDADIIGLSELENDGIGSESAVAELVAAVNQRVGFGKRYYVAPHNEAQWGDDAISVGIIYRLSKVLPLGKAAAPTGYPFEDLNRLPMVMSFFHYRTLRTVTVAVNHFKSKGGCPNSGLDADQGDGQGCWNFQRTEAARVLADYLKTNPTGFSAKNAIVLGDINAYYKEDPITMFNSQGFHSLFKENDYTFNFQANSGLLDHVFVTDNLVNRVVSATAWAVNSDEPRALDYSTDFKSEDQVRDWYQGDVFRSSDHDPLIVDFDLRWFRWSFFK